MQMQERESGETQGSHEKHGWKRGRVERRDRWKEAMRIADVREGEWRDVRDTREP